MIFLWYCYKQLCMFNDISLEMLQTTMYLNKKSLGMIQITMYFNDISLHPHFGSNPCHHFPHFSYVFQCFFKIVPTAVSEVPEATRKLLGITENAENTLSKEYSTWVIWAHMDPYVILYCFYMIYMCFYIVLYDFIWCYTWFLICLTYFETHLTHSWSHS